MSRKNSNRKASFSPVQRKACIVIVLCILAIAASCVAAWILPQKLGLGGKDGYDPAAYPVDTTLGAVLPQTGEAGSDYLTSTVFVGDQYTQSIQTANQITLNQFAGAADLKVGDLIRNTCIYFQDDATAYTVPQAMGMMKPRRVLVTLGSNNVSADLSLDAFLQDYKQALQAIAAGYSYCDIIVNSVPPVLKTSENAAQNQSVIDQINQALAAMCDTEGYKFLNSAETLKNADGYGETAYFDASTKLFNGAGINSLFAYMRSHAYETEDRRPDTDNIPQRVAQSAAGTPSATPSATPTKFTVSYQVEEGKGTLTGNGQSGVKTLEFDTGERTTVSVTAVAADGYSFYKWSDGVQDETRYDVVTQNLSVTAMFNDARVEFSLDKGDTTINMGENVTINATVKLGGKDYDNSGVQWSVNDDMQPNGASFTFTPTAAGSYTIKSGIEVNGNYQSATLVVTVNGPSTTLVITGPGSMQAGGGTTLSVTGQNITGDVTWTCDQQPGWTPTGTQVQFTAQSVGTYTIHANNNGATVAYSLVVTESAPATTQPPAPPTDGGVVVG